MSRGRVVAIVLFASLALNLFLGGVMVGGVLAPRQDAAAGPGGFGGLIANMRQVAAELPPDQQAALHEAMGRHRSEIRQDLVALRDARQATLAALAAEPFDRQAVEAAFAELLRRSQAAQAAIQDAILDAAERLPADARQELVDAGRRHGPGGIMGRGGPHPSQPHQP